MPPDTNSARFRFTALAKALGPSVLGWGVGKILDATVPPAYAGIRQVISTPWFPFSLAGLGFALGLLWASWPWLAPQLRRLRSKVSRVSGEIVLFEQMSLANHPESYANPEPNAIRKAISLGSSFDVGLHVENRGKPTRLRDWKFQIESAAPTVEARAWPPPQDWQMLFPHAISLETAEASYFDPGKVYAIYCRLRVHSPDYRTFPKPDALVVSATDNFGRVATFRVRDGHDAFQNSASTPSS